MSLNILQLRLLGNIIDQKTNRSLPLWAINLKFSENNWNFLRIDNTWYFCYSRKTLEKILFDNYVQIVKNTFT